MTTKGKGRRANHKGRAKGSKYPHSQATKDKIRATMTGKKLTQEHKDNISKGHAAFKESGNFYYTEQYKNKQRVPRPGTREAQLRRWYGRQYQHYLDEKNPKKEALVPIADDRPDWIKQWL